MKIIAGYFLLAYSVLLFVSILTFHPAESVYFISTISFPVQNLGGSLGIYVSAWFVFFFGKYASFFVPLIVFILAKDILFKNNLKTTILKLYHLAICTFLSSLLIASIFNNSSILQHGFFGESVSSFLEIYIPKEMIVFITAFILLYHLFYSVKFFKTLMSFFANFIAWTILLPVKLIARPEKKQKMFDTTPDIAVSPVHVPSFQDEKEVFEEPLADASSFAMKPTEYLPPIPTHVPDEDIKEYAFGSLNNIPEHFTEHNIPDYLTSRKGQKNLIEDIDNIFYKQTQIDKEENDIDDIFSSHFTQDTIVSTIPQKEEIENERKVIETPHFISKPPDANETHDFLKEIKDNFINLDNENNKSIQKLENTVPFKENTNDTIKEFTNLSSEKVSSIDHIDISNRFMNSPLQNQTTTHLKENYSGNIDTVTKEIAGLRKKAQLLKEQWDNRKTILDEKAIEKEDQQIEEKTTKKSSLFDLLPSLSKNKVPLSQKAEKITKEYQKTLETKDIDKDLIDSPTLDDTNSHDFKEKDSMLTTENLNEIENTSKIQDKTPSVDVINEKNEINSVAKFESENTNDILDKKENTLSSDEDDKIENLKDDNTIAIDEDEKGAIADSIAETTNRAKDENDKNEVSKEEIEKAVQLQDKFHSIQEKDEEAPNLHFPKENYKNYHFPSINLLEQNLDVINRVEEQKEIAETSRLIENTLANFGIEIEIKGFSRGPSITQYEISLPPGLKVKTITNLSDDLALSLGTSYLRIVHPIRHQSLVGIEVPNKIRRNIALRDIISGKEFKNTSYALPAILGIDITGKTILDDISTMPHLLIAGTTGSGKSVYVNALIAGLLFKKRPDELKFILIDPKMVELQLYNDIPHLLSKVITNPDDALLVLDWAVDEMHRRYELLSQFKHRHVSEYNKFVESVNKERTKAKQEKLEHLPFIIIMIDEFANLMLRSPKETEDQISKLAAMSRAVGIHLIIATQRPSVNVVTGTIKANFPCRLAFHMNSHTDSRTILDKSGAETLMGKGDMLYIRPGSHEEKRIQSPFTSNYDVEAIVSSLKNNGYPDYEIDIDALREAKEKKEQSSNSGSDIVDASEDSLFEEVIRYAVAEGEVSTSSIQRRFRMGYNRASRIMQTFKDMKIVSAPSSAGKPWNVTISEADLVNYL